MLSILMGLLLTPGLASANDEASEEEDAEEETESEEEVELEEIAKGEGATKSQAEDAPPLPPPTDLGEAMALEGVSKKQIRYLKPKRRRMSPLPRAQTDFTAYTLEWGEFDLSPFTSYVGALPRTQIGTAPALDLLTVWNGSVKVNFLRLWFLDVAGVANGYYFQRKLGGEAQYAYYWQIGARGSMILHPKWSIHGSLGYARGGVNGTITDDMVNDTVEFVGKFAGLQVPSLPDLGDTEVSPSFKVDSFNLRLTTDYRFNRRDSIIFEARMPLFLRAQANAGLYVPNLLDTSVGIAKGGWLTFDVYRFTLMWQFAFKHIEMRGGLTKYNRIKVTDEFSWDYPLPTGDASYRFGGRTRKGETRTRKGWRRNRKELKKGTAPPVDDSTKTTESDQSNFPSEED